MGNPVWSVCQGRRPRPHTRSRAGRGWWTPTHTGCLPWGPRCTHTHTHETYYSTLYTSLSTQSHRDSPKVSLYQIWSHFDFLLRKVPMLMDWRTDRHQTEAYSNTSADLKVTAELKRRSEWSHSQLARKQLLSRCLEATTFNTLQFNSQQTPEFKSVQYLTWANVTTFNSMKYNTR